MTLTYQRAATPASGWDGWGTLVYGTTRIAVRRLVVFGGIALLLMTLLLRTGEAGLGQLWASALLALPLLAVASLTRTMGVRPLGRLLLVGAALMGVMYLLALIVISPLLEFSRPRDFVVPALEQQLVVAPLAVLVWLWRAGRAWSLGATDLLLAGVAVGIGFALVEESYIRAGGAEAYLAWLPVVAEDSGRIVGGHPIWAGLGGATLGLGLLLRSRGPIWLVVAASGSLLAFLDHAAHNNVVSWGDELAELLNAITLSGWLAVLAFLALAVACIGADLRVQQRLRPLPRQPSEAQAQRGMRGRWRVHLLRRRLAMADFHWESLPQSKRAASAAEAAGVAAMLEALMTTLGPPDRPSKAKEPFGRGGESGESRHVTGTADTPLTPAARLALLALVSAGVAGLAWLASGLETGGSLALLDVGANCDWVCLLGGAAAGGAMMGDPDPSSSWEDFNQSWKNYNQMRQDQIRQEMERWKILQSQGGGQRMYPEGERDAAFKTWGDWISH